MSGFGSDTSCGPAGLITGRLVSGNRLLAEALWRMFNAPEGSLLGGDDESAWGYDVSNLVGQMGAKLAAEALPGIMRAKAMSDDRVADCEVSTSVLADDNGFASVIAKLTVTPADGGDDFPLTLAIGDVTTRIVGGLPG